MGRPSVGFSSWPSADPLPLPVRGSSFPRVALAVLTFASEPAPQRDRRKSCHPLPNLRLRTGSSKKSSEKLPPTSLTRRYISPPFFSYLRAREIYAWPTRLDFEVVEMVVVRRAERPAWTGPLPKPIRCMCSCALV